MRIHIVSFQLDNLYVDSISFLNNNKNYLFTLTDLIAFISGI